MCEYFIFMMLHGKNSFAKVFKDLSKYKSENNFVDPLK